MKTYSRNMGAARRHAIPSVKRRLAVTASTLALALLVTGCSPGGGDGKPVDIRFATGGAMPPNEQEIAIFNGELQKKGVLKKIGKDYNLKMTFTKATPEALSLLIAGEVDFATQSFSTIASAALKSAVPGGLSIVAGHFVDGNPDKFSNPYLVLEKSGINSLADLKGKKIGVNSVGSAVDVIFRHALIKAGLSPKTDVTFVEIGFGAMGQALRDGRIDVGSMVQPFFSQEMKEGGVKVLTRAVDSVGKNSAIAVVARTDFLKKNPNAAKAFLADWVSGLRWLGDAGNRDETIKIISGISKTNVAVLDVFYGKDNDYYRDINGCVSAAALQAGIDAMVAVGYLEKKVDVASLVDSSYLPDPGKCPK